MEFPYDETIDVSLPFTSPWRYAVVGSLENIYENTTALKLSEKADEETYKYSEWVEPGVVSWTWLAEGATRAGQQDIEAVKRYIDMAAELGWKYFLWDDGWQTNPANNSISDDVAEVIEYAEEKGIGILVWVNEDYIDTDEEREARFKNWSELGIKGIKADFFDGESAAEIKEYHDIYEDLAKYRLLGIMHGCNKPTGEMRTYPHILSHESVRGDEWLFVSYANTTAHITKALYIRGAVGPMDYTPILTLAKNNGQPLGGNNATVANQLALTALIDTGLPCLADNDANYKNSPAWYFLNNLPAKWDETRFVSGGVGESAVVARRNGDTWYLLGITDSAAETVEFNLGDYLSGGEYTMEEFNDGDGRFDLTRNITTVTENDTVVLNMVEHGGFAVKLYPKEESQLTAITAQNNNVTINEGEKIKLEYTVEPENEAYYLTWESDNEAAATVNDRGIVTAVAAGEAEITAKSAIDENSTAITKVTVLPGIESMYKFEDVDVTITGRTTDEWEQKSPPENAFDGDTGTYYDGQEGGWVQFELDNPRTISAFKFWPRDWENEERMVGTWFQVSENGEDYTTIYTVPAVPENGVYDVVYVNELGEEAQKLLEENKFKYFRFFSGDSTYANIYEIEVYTTDVKTNATIKYLDEDNNVLKEEVVENLFVGDSYTTNLPESVDSDGMVYEKNCENKTITLTDGENVIEVNYKQAEIASAEDVTLTTREGVLPILPEKVNVTLVNGTAAVAVVKWAEMNSADFTVANSPVEVMGSVSDTVNVKAVVTVTDKNDLLVVDYSFEENGDNNARENEYDAIVGDSLTYVDGVFGKAVQFSAEFAGDKGNGRDNPERGIEINGEVFEDAAFRETKSATISTFIRLDEFAPDRYVKLFDFGNGNNSDLYYSLENGGWAGRIELVSNGGNVYPAYNIPEVDKWVHIAITIDYVNDNQWDVTVYKNGEVANVDAGGGNPSPTGTFTKPFYEIEGNYFIGISNWTDPILNGTIDNFQIYADALKPEEIRAMATPGSITVNYTYNDTVIKTDKLPIWKGNDRTIPEQYYSANGDNYLYHADRLTIEDFVQSGEEFEIEMSRCESKSQYDKGATLEKDGKRYTFVTGENMVPNGNFSYNLAGWYRGNTAGEGPKANKKYFRADKENGVVIDLRADNGDGTGSGSDLYRAWKVEKGKTYFFTSRFQNDCGWARLSKGDNISVAANSATVIKTGFYTGVNEVLFTADTDYVWINVPYYLNSYVGNFGLYEIAECSIVTLGEEETVVINNEKFTLPEDAIMYYETQASVGTVYLPETEVTITEDMTFTAYYDTGLTMVDGAQVRIGEGVNEEDKVAEGSGLRFITTVNNADTIASISGAEFGVEITAEGSSAEPLDIPATKWQEEGVVYTTAITNLAETNFNRKFTAVPYVKVGGYKFYKSTPVTRSIYQVASGLLAKESTDNTEYDESAIQSEILYKVLNAYVNQTGIRLTLTDDGDKTYSNADIWTVRTEGTGSYTGDAFFSVRSAECDENGKYTVVLETIGEKTTINMNYWNEYIRINNNNKQIKVATSLTDNGNGTYTLTFDTNNIGVNAN